MLREAAARQQRDEMSRLPADLDELTSLVEAVEDAVEQHGCDHSLRYAISACERLGLNGESVSSWLRDQGGCCDCEVVMNVSDSIDRIRRGRFA